MVLSGQLILGYYYGWNESSFVHLVSQSWFQNVRDMNFQHVRFLLPQGTLCICLSTFPENPLINILWDSF